MKPTVSVDSKIWRGQAASGSRVVAAETPVAFVYDGGTEAVMMATPADLEDFALGFSLNDGIIASAEEVTDLAVVEVEQGIELRMQLSHRNREALVTRRRHRAGNGSAESARCAADEFSRSVHHHGPRAAGAYIHSQKPHNCSLP